MYPLCANCGIEIRWQPTWQNGVVYCCAGCSQGGPCTCDYEHLPQDNAEPAACAFPSALNAVGSAEMEQVREA